MALVLSDKNERWPPTFYMEILHWLSLKKYLIPNKWYGYKLPGTSVFSEMKNNCKGQF